MALNSHNRKINKKKEIKKKRDSPSWDFVTVVVRMEKCTETETPTRFNLTQSKPSAIDLFITIEI